jgi:hypothetical protein
MQRTIKIIVVCLALLFYAGDMQAQSYFTKQQQLPEINSARLLHLPDDSAVNTNKPSLNALVPADYYTRHFGFFCDKELRLEKSTGVPLRFRLGSLESCNKLEGKIR